jgi:CHAT domain
MLREEPQAGCPSPRGVALRCAPVVRHNAHGRCHPQAHQRSRPNRPIAGSFRAGATASTPILSPRTFSSNPSPGRQGSKRRVKAKVPSYPTTCATTVGGSPGVEGQVALAKAFLYAGARGLLVSYWLAPAAGIANLTTNVFAELAKEPTIGRAEALRRSILAMLDPASPPEFAHPGAWSAFVLMGDINFRKPPERFCHVQSGRSPKGVRLRKCSTTAPLAVLRPLRSCIRGAEVISGCLT